MVPETITLLRHNIAHYVIVVVVVVMLELMMQATGIVTLVFAGLSMLYTHRMVQLGEVHGWADPLGTTGKDGSKVPVVGYLLRFLALFMVLMLLMAGGFLALGVSGISPEADGAFAFWGIAVGTPLFCGLLALIGSVLPACAERADTSLSAALKRGRKAFGRDVLHLLTGPVAVGIAGMALLAGTGWQATPDSPLLQRIAYQALVTVLTLVPAILAAVILSRAYLRAESRPSA